jgi:flagellar export protein FliJ
VFRFRLEKVLRHRRRLVDDEARKLQVLAAHLNRLLAERRQFEDDIELAGQAAYEQSHQQVDIVIQRSSAAFIEGRRTMVRRLTDRIHDAQYQADRQRSVLIEVQQNVSVLENLEVRQREDWEQEERRREQKEFDEIGGRRRAAGNAY